VCKTPLSRSGATPTLSCLWALTYFQKGLCLPDRVQVRSLDRSFPGPFVPETNKHCRPFPPRTIRSLDSSFHGTFVPGTLDLSCRGPFVHLSAVADPGGGGPPPIVIFGSRIFLCVNVCRIQTVSGTVSTFVACCYKHDICIGI